MNSPSHYLPPMPPNGSLANPPGSSVSRPYPRHRLAGWRTRPLDMRDQGLVALGASAASVGLARECRVWLNPLRVVVLHQMRGGSSKLPLACRCISRAVCYAGCANNHQSSIGNIFRFRLKSPTTKRFLYKSLSFRYME